MYRTVTCLILLSISVHAFAQRPIGPLTISGADHVRPSSTMVHALRGGAPYNDSCHNAVIYPLPADGIISITGDNTGSTDTEDFGNPVSWEAFTTDTCASITISYCGTDPLFEVVYSILITGCPEFEASVQNSGTGFCIDGNATITYESLAAGTYYIPVLGIAGSTGPYTITVASDVCDLPPLNDICGNAAPVLIVQECMQGTVAGSNANAVINSAPPCATTQSQFQDVWYQFESGTATEVLITIDPGTIGDIGVEVREACAGPSVFCATGDTEYSVAVEPGMNYRVRVFSNNDFGFGGTFGICITLPGACAAGTVTGPDGSGSVVACANGGDPLLFEQSGGSGTGFAFIVTDLQDTIIAVLVGAELALDGLLPGDYLLWGLAYEGDLSGALPGQSLGSVSSTEGCLDLTSDPVAVTIEVCAGLGGAGGTGSEMSFVCAPEGTLMRWAGPSTAAMIELLDARGRLVSQKDRTLEPGQQVLLLPNGSFAPGIWTVIVRRLADPPLAGRVFVH